MSSEGTRGANALGIDVSHFQGTVNWNEVKQGGISFGFAKATEGLNTNDAMFQTNWNAMQAAGIIRGTYHFFHASEDATAQANHFLSKAAIGPNDLPPVLDVEQGGLDHVSNQAEILNGVKTWLDVVGTKLGRTPILYASPAFANEYFAGELGNYPLWVAEYGVSQPKIPTGWNTWTFWQYTQYGKASGVAGNADLDYFNGSYDDLLAFLKGGE